MKRHFAQLSLRLASGLAIHGVLACLVLLLNPPPRPDPTPKVSVPISIAIRPKAPAPLLPSPFSSPSSSAASAPASERPKKAQVPQGGKAPLAYEEMLPKAHELQDSATREAPPAQASESFAQHSFGAELDGRQKQELLRDGGTLATLFDVPLALRRGRQELTAYAAISLEDGKKSDQSGGLKLEYLNGEPILRAVIYETLLDARCQEILKRTLNLLKGKRLRLEIVTLPRVQEQSNVEASFFWKGAQLTLVKTSPPEVSSLIPDRAAEVAKAWDREALQRLHNSLAYRVPLRQRSLGRLN